MPVALGIATIAGVLLGGVLFAFFLRAVHDYCHERDVEMGPFFIWTLFVMASTAGLIFLCTHGAGP